jgi:hypothetical protein
MPATFPSHAAVVLPLKLVRSQWFDGVALVIGSTAPDLSYPLIPAGLLLYTHSWLSLLWWTLPVTVVGSLIVRWAAPRIAANLPADPWFALRDYAVLARSRPSWWITATSAVLGGASHIFWDGFTHPPSGGWFVAAHPVMTQEAYAGWPWWQVAQWTSTGVGGLAAVGMFLYIGRRRLLIAWHGEVTPMASRPAVFWTVLGIVGCAGTAASFADPQGLFVQGVRWLLAWSVALVVAGWLSTVRPAARRTTHRRCGVPQDRGRNPARLRTGR